MRAIAPQVEDRGIDEIYIDLTERRRPRGRLPADDEGDPDDAEPHVVVARARRREATQGRGARGDRASRCSIGVAPNKLLAKIASELDKPDGLTMLRTDDIPTRIWPLPARKINGIGPKASGEARRARHRAPSASSRQADRAWLVEHFGASYGALAARRGARPRRARPW